MGYWIPVAAMSLVLAGCAGTATAPDHKTVSVDELSGQWQIESIDQGGIIDSSHITLTFTEDGRVSGSSGCNRYSASVSQQDDRVLIHQAVSTRMTCAPSLMQQEQRFLSALQETTAFYTVSETWLVAEDAQGTPRLKMLPLSTGN
ncbi:heat-inducible protein [Marinomonas aquimarina]|uniref:Heat-inducible protein n=1 Tax=Marinomonas aquimarina TaxID=295068 RepID=A0A1A8TER1_9GAMM|nr:META domain-containing protein [Marinomonas aquimarina]SBS30583.1 heat-inducible protein [Marinomonas aquimarina]